MCKPNKELYWEIVWLSDLQLLSIGILWYLTHDIVLQAFSRNGRPTITARDARFQNAMGNREGLSFKDIALANSIYTCAQGKTLIEVN